MLILHKTQTWVNNVLTPELKQYIALNDTIIFLTFKINWNVPLINNPVNCNSKCVQGVLSLNTIWKNNIFSSSTNSDLKEFKYNYKANIVNVNE